MEEGADAMGDVAIEHVPDRGFTAEVEGHRIGLDYRLSDGVVTILHTEVPYALRGRGLAGRLVRAAFEYAREAGLKVAPRCSYAAEWVARHPEYADLVAG